MKKALLLTVFATALLTTSMAFAGEDTINVSAWTDGVPFTNPTGQGRYFCVRVFGQWTYGTDTPWFNANGKPENGTSVSYLPMAALIMRRANGTYEMVGTANYFYLDISERVEFFMNDGYRSDNQGTLTVYVGWGGVC